MNVLKNYFKRLAFIFYILFLSSLANAQSYQLKGSFVKPISGKVFLIPAISDEKYYGKSFRIDSAKITQGKFLINRNTDAEGIFPFILFVESNEINGSTNMVFLSPKDQEITIDTIDNYKSPGLKGSLVQSEMNEYYDVYFKDIVSDIRRFIIKSERLENKYQGNLPETEEMNMVSESDELKRKGDSLSLEYTRSHPNSLISLWKLIERFKNNGYKDQYSMMFHLLSEDIKNTPAANVFFKELQSTEKIIGGKIFPVLKLKNEYQEVVNVDIANRQKDNRYVLVDLWFHNCIPCLRQFPILKGLYEEYRYAGFEVIGISVDKKDDFSKWTKTLKKEDLKWPNYLDENGINSESLAINYFPYNFLLNGQGEIIKKNISVYELRSLLEKNLKIRDNIRLLTEPD